MSAALSIEPATTGGGIRSREDLIALAVSMARPVVRSTLSIDHADAAIAAAVGRAWRLGILDGVSEPDQLIDVARHILRQHIQRQEDKRDVAASEIGRAMWPLIQKQNPPHPRNRIRADAHDLNGEMGFLLSEAEVEQVLIDQLLRARAQTRERDGVLPPQRQHRPRRYHGG